LKGTQVQRLVLKDGQVVAHEELLEDQGERIRDVRQGPDGALYVLTEDGKLWRLSPG
jgi:glucose/arabinose dehydrogenase